MLGKVGDYNKNKKEEEENKGINIIREDSSNQAEKHKLKSNIKNPCFKDYKTLIYIQ